MHRDGLFFDPLDVEDDAPAQAPVPAPEQTAGPDTEPVRHRRVDPEELQAQRRRELARVQAELRRMAAGPRR
ncbi:hypothetical protein [Arthrobacter sp. B0490]|uniref:hypothetical protein n=1 Tax=Arthrobacter sp. B0490 TaxID=2058891 RepID=UPI000CE3B9EB|nr:hypothetical protein [Arthrobacter sp. B0490]